MEGKTIRPSRSVRAGQVVEYLPPPPEPAEPAAEPIELNVVHEDEWIVVLDKPRSMVVHPAAGHRSGTLVNALLHHCPDLKGVGGVLRPGIVHRLDKDTSGLMVVTKEDRAHRTLAAQFKSHEIERRYLALVSGRLKRPAGVFDTPYGRHPKHRKRFSSRPRRGLPGRRLPATAIGPERQRWSVRHRTATPPRWQSAVCRAWSITADRIAPTGPRP